MRDRTDPPNFEKRYESFRDDRGEWSFEIQEYQADLDLITPSDVPATLTPKEAYRAAVFLEGFIQEKKSTEDWSDSTLDKFNKFESTIEVEAVAKALRKLSNQNEPN